MPIGNQKTNSDNTKTPPAPPGGSGISSGLNPGGTTPGGGPGNSGGSLGTGGAKTGNEPASNVKKDGR